MTALFEVVPNTTEGIDALPKSDLPYYVVAQEGFFLNRKTQIGRVILPETKKPDTLKPTGYPKGVFLWEGPKIPGKIIAQATHFFRRILTKHNTEAEVIITMHNETGAFRLFVPFQRVSHGGVKSVYEPTHIDRNYTVVGTLHSHCDFSAFHSGTDSADASEMDGIHFTIGMLNREIPEIVAMVTMGGKEFHYEDPATVADLDWTCDTAPPWWDEYVFPATTESDKPKALKSITQDQWNESRGVVAKKTRTSTTTFTPATNRGWVTGEYGWNGYRPREIPTKGQPTQWRGSEDNARYQSSYSRPLIESEKFSKRRKRNKSPNWDDTGALVNYDTADEVLIDFVLDEAYDLGLLQNSEWISISKAQVDSIDYWRLHFTEKQKALADILALLGVDDEPAAPATSKPLPGQTTLFIEEMS